MNAPARLPQRSPPRASPRPRFQGWLGRVVFAATLGLCVVLLSLFLAWRHDFYREVEHHGEALTRPHPPLKP